MRESIQPRAARCTGKGFCRSDLYPLSCHAKNQCCGAIHGCKWIRFWIQIQNRRFTNIGSCWIYDMLIRGEIDWIQI